MPTNVIVFNGFFFPSISLTTAATRTYLTCKRIQLFSNNNRVNTAFKQNSAAAQYSKQEIISCAHVILSREHLKLFGEGSVTDEKKIFRKTKALSQDMAINVLLHKGINCRENNDSHTILIIKNRVRNVFILYYERKKKTDFY